MWMLLVLLPACVAPTDTGAPADSGTGDTGDTGDADDTGDTGDTGETGDTGDTELVFDETTDVVIVGAGPAGLAAAIEAHEAGAAVVLLEREAAAGGAAIYAGGHMLFSGTPEQVAAGISDSPAQLTAEWASFTGGDVTDPWFQRFAAENVPEVHDWLAAMGLTWNAPKADPSAGDTPRAHTVSTSGVGLAATLEANLPEGCLRLESPVEELLVVDGRVVGVRWADAEGEHTLGADAVLVATGGFLRNLTRIEALFPELPRDQLLYASAPGADGNGLDLLEALGAATQNLDAIGFYAHAHPHPTELGEEVSGPMIGLYPWINADAERFADESQINSFAVGRTRMMQPGGQVWLIGDAGLDEEEYIVPGQAEPSVTVHQLVEAGIATRAATLADLTAAIGVSEATTSATVTAWNDAAAGLVGDPWRDPGAEPAEPVTTAPFYAVPIGISAAKAFGGVEVDLDGRVLRPDGTPIEGLWAAGELTGMAGGSLVGETGFTGSLTAVVLGGRVAGRSAAEAALQ